MLRVLAEVVCGEAPAISDVMLVRSALAHSADIYEPIIGITEQIHGAHMDVSMGGSLVRHPHGGPDAMRSGSPSWQHAASRGRMLRDLCKGLGCEGGAAVMV